MVGGVGKFIVGEVEHCVQRGQRRLQSEPWAGGDLQGRQRSQFRIMPHRTPVHAIPECRDPVLCVMHAGALFFGKLGSHWHPPAAISGWLLEKVVGEGAGAGPDEASGLSSAGVPRSRRGRLLSQASPASLRDHRAHIQ